MFATHSRISFFPISMRSSVVFAIICALLPVAARAQTTVAYSGDLNTGSFNLSIDIRGIVNASTYPGVTNGSAM
ncbi:MAG: hypothetical protein WCB27_12490, partial [Thermoguttaceae bacterium]